MQSGIKRHIGILERIDENNEISVKISRNQCDGCKLGDMCSVSAEDLLKFECDSSDLQDLCLGDKVIVEESQNLEWTAIGLCLFLPFLLFFVVVIWVSSISSVLYGVLGGIAILVAYYGMFYLLRRRLNFNRIKFVVKKI